MNPATNFEDGGQTCYFSVSLIAGKSKAIYIFLD